jgi:CxxC motif-containing protein (DUF1111 family)
MRRGWVALLAGATLFSSVLALGQDAPVRPGDPLASVTPKESADFLLGRDIFTQEASIDDGLGPAFNANSCAVCHNVPVIGGTGAMLETRAAIRDANGTTRALTGGGDTLIHLFSLPPHDCQVGVPEEANVIAHRISIPLFGAGLIEAIPDETLRDLEDPDDRNRDNISGRAAIVDDVATGERKVGRFGWKAQQATLLAFAADAERNEMGVTTDLFPREYAYGISDEQMRRCDTRPDPEDPASPNGGSTIHFVNFMRLLAPVARGAIDSTVLDGERLFVALGCGTCHVPTLTTGVSAHPAFNRKAVPLYSDLLLHDVGTGDGIPQGAARPEEIRTPPLWGLRLRRPLLHDGSAATPRDAILRHGGEAEQAMRRFVGLSEENQARLVAFLKSL